MFAASWVKWSLAAVLAVGTIPAVAMARPVKRASHRTTHKTTVHKPTHAPLRTATPKLAAVTHTPAYHAPVRKPASKKTTIHRKSSKHAPVKVVHRTAAR